MRLTIPVPDWFELKYVFAIRTAKPLPKKRPKASTASGFVKFYNPQSKDEMDFKLNIKRKIGNAKPLEGPVFVDMLFLMRRPKIHYGTGKNEGTLKSSADVFHVKKPDEDNLLKFIKDAMNKLVYRDDSQVVGAFTWKEYSQDTGVIVKVYELKG